jgi:hypothetical protein
VQPLEARIPVKSKGNHVKSVTRFENALQTQKLFYHIGISFSACRGNNMDDRTGQIRIDRLKMGNRKGRIDAVPMGSEKFREGNRASKEPGKRSTSSSRSISSVPVRNPSSETVTIPPLHFIE